MIRKMSAGSNAVVTNGYTPAEEIANSITHGLGALLSVAALTLLVTLAAQQFDVWRIVSFSIYGATMVLLFLSSTLYHSFQKPSVRRIFKTLDHCSIYLLIAGTYTPFLLVTLRGTLGWVLFGIIWALAVAGIVIKVAFGPEFKKFSVVTYLVMGWLVLFASKELFARLAIEGIYWLVAGGLIYTLGVVFYLWRRLPFNHAIWHLFVLAGTICHFFAIFFYVL